MYWRRSFLLRSSFSAFLADDGCEFGRRLDEPDLALTGITKLPAYFLCLSVIASVIPKSINTLIKPLHHLPVLSFSNFTLGVQSKKFSSPFL